MLIRNLIRRHLVLEQAGEATPGGAPAPAPAAPGTSALADLGVTPGAPAPAPADPNASPAPSPPADALQLPGPDAKPEDWQAFYAKLGRPETAAGYEAEKLVPEGADPAFAKTAAEWFHEAGLRPEQASKLAEKWNAFAAEQQAAATKQAADAEAARIAALDAKNKAEQGTLKNEWGAQYEANVELGRRAATQFMGADAAEMLTAIEDRLGYAKTMRIMAAIGKGLGEADAPGLGGGNTPPAPKTLAERLYPNSPN